MWFILSHTGLWFLLLLLNKLLNKQPRFRWFETPWHQWDFVAIICRRALGLQGLHELWERFQGSPEAGYLWGVQLELLLRQGLVTEARNKLQKGGKGIKHKYEIVICPWCLFFIIASTTCLTRAQFSVKLTTILCMCIKNVHKGLKCWQIFSCDYLINCGRVKHVNGFQLHNSTINHLL